MRTTKRALTALSTLAVLSAVGICRMDSPASAKPLPCNANTTLTLYVPSSSTHGTLMLEDQWPGYGDLDFNDAVITYQYAFAYNTAGNLVELTATFNVLAAGNGRDNGFALALPVPKANVSSVTLQKGNGAPSALSPRAAEANLVVDILANTKSAFDAVGNGHQINTDPGQAVLPGTTYQLVVTLGTPTALSSAGAPFDAFFYWSDSPSHEIHRPGFAGTAAMDAALFNTLQDGSTGARHFVDNRGIPYVLDVPVVSKWSQESVDISSSYAQLAAFGQSGGVSNQDWYQSPSLPTLFTAGQGGALPPQASFIGGDGSYSIDGQCDLCISNNVTCPAAPDRCHDQGTCAPSTGVCSAPPNKANGTPCNDGNADTGGDVCTGGACAGSNLCVTNNVTCSAVGQCQNQGTCAPGTGVCSAATNKADGTVCDDGNGGTSNDICTSGTCAGSVVAGCVAQNPVSAGSFQMDTHSHGGGFSPSANEYWYPEWSNNTVYRHNKSTKQLLGTFQSQGTPNLMQLWGDTDGSYYTATWGNNTIQKLSSMGGGVVWTYNLGTTASTVTADANYVYAMPWGGGNTVTKLNKANGSLVSQFNLNGGTFIGSYGGLAVSGGRLYYGDYNGLVNVYDLGTNSLISSFNMGTNIYNMSFDGENYCVSPNSSTVTCYKIASCSGGGGGGGGSACTDPGGDKLIMVADLNACLQTLGAAFSNVQYIEVAYGNTSYLDNICQAMGYSSYLTTHGGDQCNNQANMYPSHCGQGYLGAACFNGCGNINYDGFFCQ